MGAKSSTLGIKQVGFEEAVRRSLYEWKPVVRIDDTASDVLDTKEALCDSDDTLTDVLDIKEALCPNISGKSVANLRHRVFTEYAAKLAKPTESLRFLSHLLTNVEEYSALIPFVCLPALETPAEVYIRGLMAPLLQRLVDGRFSGHLNGHCYILEGARGCGKSSALKRLALTASVRWPTLRVVFVNAERIDDESHVLQKHGSLIKFVGSLGLTAAHASSALLPDNTTLACAQLCTLGAAKSIATFDELVKHLRDSKLYLLVIVDDLDQLYRSKSAFAMNVLRDIHTFSDQDFGRTALLGCTSSSFTYAMINGRKEPERLKSEYFVSDFNSDMNGEKLPLKTVSLPAPTNTNVVAEFVRDARASETLILQRRRLVMFAHGGNPRMRSFGDFHLAPLAALKDTSSPISPLISAFLTEYKHAEPFLRSIYDELCMKNAALLAAACDFDTGEINHRKVSSIDWDAKFTPLTQADVLSLWGQITSDPDALPDAILRFFQIDVAAIVYDEKSRGYYPSSILSLHTHLKEVAQRMLALADWASIAKWTAAKAPFHIMFRTVQAEAWKGVGVEVWGLVRALANAYASRMRQ